MKDIAIGFSIGIVLTLALYFLVYVPDVDKAYKKGLDECYKETDTVIIKSDPVIEYRDTSFTSREPVEVEDKDTSLTLISSMDTTYQSGMDSIYLQVTGIYHIKKDSSGWNTQNIIADWFSRIVHRDYTPIPDTVKIYTPKYIEKVEVKNNWLITLISYLAGIASAIIIYLTAK